MKNTGTLGPLIDSRVLGQHAELTLHYRPLTKEWGVRSWLRGKVLGAEYLYTEKNGRRAFRVAYDAIRSRS